MVRLFFEKMFLETLVVTLAERFGIPGFQHRRAAKWPDQLVAVLGAAIETLRQQGKPVTDFDFCLEFVQKTDPSYAGRKNLPQAKKAARQLCNRLSRLRVQAKRIVEHREYVAEQKTKTPRVH